MKSTCLTYNDTYETQPSCFKKKKKNADSLNSQAIVLLLDFNGWTSKFPDKSVSVPCLK